MNKRLPFAKMLLATTAVLVAVGAFSRAAALNRGEQEFLKNASEFNLSEIELGRLAQERAGSAEIRDAGSRVASDHSKAQAELQALAQTKDAEIGTEPSNQQRQMLNAFAGKSGAEFDREFRERQAKEHERAIRSFSDAARESRDPDVKAYATKQLAGLQQHLTAVSSPSNGDTPGSQRHSEQHGVASDRGTAEREAARVEKNRQKTSRTATDQEPSRSGRTEGRVGTE